MFSINVPNYGISRKSGKESLTRAGCGDDPWKYGDLSAASYQSKHAEPRQALANDITSSHEHATLSTATVFQTFLQGRALQLLLLQVDIYISLSMSIR